MDAGLLWLVRTEVLIFPGYILVVIGILGRSKFILNREERYYYYCL